MARPVASPSSTAGRDRACPSGPVMPASNTSCCPSATASPFSACTCSRQRVQWQLKTFSIMEEASPASRHGAPTPQHRWPAACSTSSCKSLLIL
jgi:hypothetical protein